MQSPRAWLASRRRRRAARRRLVRFDRSSIAVDVDGREAVVQGELLVRERGEPQFAVYGGTEWNGGDRVSERDLERIRAVLEELDASGAFRLEFVGELVQLQVRPA